MTIGFAVYQLAFVPGQSEPNSNGTPASRKVRNAYAHRARAPMRSSIHRMSSMAWYGWTSAMMPSRL